MGHGVLPLGVIVLWVGGMKISFVAPHISDKASSQHVSYPAETKMDREEQKGSCLLAFTQKLILTSEHQWKVLIALRTKRS